MSKSSLEKTIVWFLWTLVGLGIVIRLVNPFFHHPLDYLSAYWFSDPYRHYKNAIDCFSKGGIWAAQGIIDPIGYQVFLAPVLRITATARVAVGIYTALLSIITPWLWYRWMLLSVGNRTLALAGYAILSLLPDWIRLYQFFMQETLLLPLLGLSLWISWLAAEKQTLSSHVLAGLAWGAALSTKATIIPIAIFVLPWLFFKSYPNKKLALPAATIMIALVLYALSPLKIYTRIHAIVLIPPGDQHRILYESGKKALNIVFRFDDTQDGHREYACKINCSSLYKPQLKPFSNWESDRDGSCDFTVDFTKPPGQYLPPSPSVTLANRLKYTAENIIYFFFGLSWQEDWIEDNRLGSLYESLALVRFIWLPITLAVLFLAIKNRVLSIMTVLFAGSMTLFLCQQSFIMEARYKKPWEGVAIATLLFLLKPRSSSASTTAADKSKSKSAQN